MKQNARSNHNYYLFVFQINMSYPPFELGKSRYDLV